MGSYSKIASGKCREFCITLGLKEGYGPDARIRGVEEVEELLQTWMKMRMIDQRPIVTGTLIYGKTVYAWSGNDSDSEPTAMFRGEVSIIYNQNLSDVGAEYLIQELAIYLASTLNQTRVYVSFMGQISIFQKNKDETETVS